MANKATRSLTAGMKVLGGANTPTFTLEYLSPVKGKQQGAFETIVVPYVELGRDRSCGIRFGDDTPTVSRKHAAIERKGDETYVINLSASNPTLVNGRPVNDRYFLNNGDEIQLSLEGPRLRYNTTKQGTAKMGFTSRMNLVMQQSIRPYRTAVIAISMVLLISIGVAGFLIYNMQQTLVEQENLIALQTEITQAQADSLAQLNARNVDLSDRFLATRQAFEQERTRRERESAQMASTIEDLREQSEELLASGGNINYADIIEPLKGHVLALRLHQLVMNVGGESQAYDFGGQLSCTGFLMEDGLFVTARHCIDLYGLEEGSAFAQANIIEHSGGSAVFHFTAESYDGEVNFSFTNKDLTADYSQDAMHQIQLDENTTGAVRETQFFAGADWAYMQTSLSGGLDYDKALSRQLRNGTDLFVLGYSYGERLRSSGNLEPYFSTAKVALSGIENGVIQAAEAGSDGGNSGGPVFTLVDGEPIVIGIVTGAYVKIDYITPIGNF